MMAVLETIEIAFRTQTAHVLAHKYGALGYLESINFDNPNYHKEMKEKIFNEIDKSDEIFIKHRKKKYNNQFPAWVILEVITFGLLSKIYSNLKTEDKKEVAKTYYQLSYYIFKAGYVHFLYLETGVRMIIEFIIKNLQLGHASLNKTTKEA